MLLGIFLFLMGFLGCCGAAKKNKCMLNIFSGVMILLIVGMFLEINNRKWSFSNHPDQGSA